MNIKVINNLNNLYMKIPPDRQNSISFKSHLTQCEKEYPSTCNRILSYQDKMNYLDEVLRGFLLFKENNSKFFRNKKALFSGNRSVDKIIMDIKILMDKVSLSSKEEEINEYTKKKALVEESEPKKKERIDYVIVESKDTKIPILDLVKSRISTKTRVPGNFYCSISNQIMVNPYFAADGNSYEYEEIYSWIHIQEKITSPLEGTDLASDILIQNKNLKSMIIEFLEKNQQLYDQEEVYFSQIIIDRFINALKAYEATDETEKYLKDIELLAHKDRRLLTQELHDDKDALDLCIALESFESYKVIFNMIYKNPIVFTKRKDFYHKLGTIIEGFGAEGLIFVINECQLDNIFVNNYFRYALDNNQLVVIECLMENKMTNVDIISKNPLYALKLQVLNMNRRISKLESLLSNQL